KDSRLVYSTDKGKVKETPAAPTPPPSDGFVRIARETKGRGGKCVCIIKGLSADISLLNQHLKALKQLCGTGGTLKQFDLEIQGDHREKIKSYLEQKGFKVKLAGG
ncbi:MAG TPA: stress response translation initiation inhibitor YciH, partial [Cellvibrionaceae bacterium]|nr:stress response translation initiation inhibitor YciH [Cellvibrionaceae bacterium]